MRISVADERGIFHWRHLFTAYFTIKWARCFTVYTGYSWFVLNKSRMNSHDSARITYYYQLSTRELNDWAHCRTVSPLTESNGPARLTFDLFYLGLIMKHGCLRSSCSESSVRNFSHARASEFPIQYVRLTLVHFGRFSAAVGFSSAFCFAWPTHLPPVFLRWCTQARKTTHRLDKQHQDVDRTVCGRVNQNDRG